MSGCFTASETKVPPSLSKCPTGGAFCADQRGTGDHVEQAGKRMNGDAWQVRANMTQGDTAVGGKLAVADGRLTFTPHGLDRSIGGTAFDVLLTEIVSIDMAPRTFDLFNGGMRKRLRVRLVDGVEALFVVNRVVKVGQRMARCARAVGGAPTVNL